MRALVTGVTGFVGPYLVKELVNKGYEVFGFDKTKKNVSGCEVFECDVLDKEKVFSIINDVKPDVIFHLAGQSSAAKSFEIPELTRRINVDGTRNLFDAVVKANIKPKILVVSSAHVYGRTNEEILKETSELNPESPYAESRVEQENLVFGYAGEHNLEIFVSRSFNHTGPGQQQLFVCSDFAKQIVDIERGERKPVIFVGNTASKIDFSDVRDVVRAYVLLVEKAKPGICNVCSGRGYSIKWIIDTLLSMSDVKVSVRRDPKKFRKKELMIGDNSKIKALGWASKISFEQTLKEILGYWRNQ